MRFALADAAFRENTLFSVQAAASFVPTNAAYHELLAEHLEAVGQNPDLELKFATDLSPREARYWVRRAFRAEVERKYHESERYLLQAQAVDRGFDPRWALMNFYFRRGDLAEFWKYAHETLARGYGDLDPVFRLCLAANDDPEATRRILPERRSVIFSFFAYLVRQGRFDYGAKVAGELSSRPEADEVPELVNYCTKSMIADSGSALRVWNGLCAAHLLPFAALAPEHGQVVTNENFATQPTRGGFDWKYSADPSISITPSDTGAGLSIDLSGGQQDRVALIEQEIPLTPGKQYAVHYEYRLIGPPDDSGLHWAVFPANPESGSELAMSSVLAGKDWQSAKLAFSVDRDAARLVLVYRRTLGTVRWKGTVQLRTVTSELQPNSKK